MKPSHWILRLALSQIVLDMLFTVGYLWLFLILHRLPVGPTVTCAALMAGLRALIIYNYSARWLRPSERFSSSAPTVSASRQMDISLEELNHADGVLQQTPLRLAILVAGMWTGCMAVLCGCSALEQGIADAARMSVGAIPLALGFGLAVFAVAHCATELLVISPAAQNARLAHAKGRPLQRARRSLTARIVAAMVASTLAPAVVILGAMCVRATLDTAPTNGYTTELTACAGLLFMSLVWSSVCAILVARTILSSVGNVIGTVRRFGEQTDGPPAMDVQAPFNDELSDLNETVGGAFESLSRLTQAASTIASGELGAEILGQGRLPDALRAMSSRVRTLVEETSSTSSELASAAVEISAAAQELEIASSSQASGMIEISQTMDSLLRSASHISDAVQGVAQNAERTLQNTEQMVTRIDLLSTHANRIGDILEVIREIANQSDLLALNGSLEATRVGEAGRGFALVAGEMRRLAERVTASVHDVKKLVADIRESGASTVVATEESKKLAEATAGAARSITLATQQQRSSTEQVNQSVRALSEIVEQAALATTQTRTSAEGLRVFADRLNQVVSGFNVTSLAR